MNEKVLSGVSNELLRLVEDFEIGSIPFAARDIEWLFYDDELKPFLQWIIQLFSSENILTPDEREQYQKLQKSNKLLTNSSDLKEKCVTIELNYPGLFNCNDSRVQFLEKKLTLLKIVERNFQNLVEFQTDLNGRLNEEVTELRELKHNAATCLNQWQNKCLHFAKTFDGFQQNLTATILQTNIQEHLENNMFTNSADLEEINKKILATLHHLKIVINSTNDVLLRVKNQKNNLIKDGEEIIGLYEHKIRLEAESNGFILDDADFVKIHQIATVSSCLDLDRLHTEIDNHLIDNYRSNLKVLNGILAHLEDVLSVLLLRKLYYVLEKTLAEKMVQALQKYLEFAHHETIIKSKMNLLKSGEITVLTEAPNFKNGLSPFLNHLMALSKSTKKSPEAVLQDYQQLKIVDLEQNERSLATEMVRFLKQIYPVNAKINTMLNYLFSGPTTTPILVPPEIFPKLNIHWEKMFKNEQSLKLLTKLFDQISKELQNPNLKRYKYFLWIYFYSDSRKLAVVMQDIITKGQQLKSRRPKHHLVSSLQ